MTIIVEIQVLHKMIKQSFAHGTNYYYHKPAVEHYYVYIHVQVQAIAVKKEGTTIEQELNPYYNAVA